MDPLLLVGGAVGLWLVTHRRDSGDSDSAPSSAREVEALARGLASEASRHSLEERTAIAWALRNDAQKTGRSIYEAGGGGSWGAQGDPGASGRPRKFSTARAASSADRELAELVLSAPQEADPIAGASAFFEPGLQDLLAARGAAYREDPDAHPDWERFRRYFSDSEELRARWSKRGQSYVTNVGRWEFWT